MSEVRYRLDHAGLERGTHLLFCTSAWQLAIGYADFVDYTGLRDDQVFSAPVVATPIPRYAEQVAGRRWAGVAPEALWHPLFWLPERVWRRRVIEDLVEPEQVWAVRVCLEVQAAELYDPDLGWFDVLAETGIRTGDSDDMVRVLAWLNGAGEPTLDDIDLEDRLLDDDGDWAADTASGMTGAFQGRAWAVIADELLGYLEEQPSSTAEAAEQLRTVAQLATSTFGLVDVPGVAEPYAFWAAVEDAAGELARGAGPWPGIVEDARIWLDEVRDHYWPNLEIVDRLAASVAEPAR